MAPSCPLFARFVLFSHSLIRRSPAMSLPKRHLSVGDRATRRVQLSRAMVERFAELSGDTNPVHMEPTSGEIHTVVHGALLNSLVSAVMGTELPGPGCLVARQTLEFPAVCLSGDLVEVAVWVMAVRKLISTEFSVTSVNRGVNVMRGTAQLVGRKPTTK